MSSWGVRGGSDVEEVVNEAAADALEVAGKDLLEKSQKLCPKKRGWNSGLVSTSRLEVDRKNLTMRVLFGGKGARHARLQHEKHYKHKPGEQWKYIEQPLNENANEYLGLVAGSIRKKIS